MCCEFGFILVYVHIVLQPRKEFKSQNEKRGEKGKKYNEKAQPSSRYPIRKCEMSDILKLSIKLLLGFMFNVQCSMR